MRGGHAGARRRPWLVRALAAFRRHPVRTVLRTHNRAMDHTGFGLGQITVIGGFVVTVTVWIIIRLWSVG